MMKPDDQSSLPSQPQSKWATRSSMLADLKGFSEQRWIEFELVYKPLLLFWIRKKNVPASAIDDVLQNSWFAIAKGIAGFDKKSGKGTFRGWLRTTVRTKVVDQFRRQQQSPRGRGGTTAQLQMGRLEDPLAKDGNRIELMGPFESRSHQNPIFKEPEMMGSALSCFDRRFDLHPLGQSIRPRRRSQRRPSPGRDPGPHRQRGQRRAVCRRP